MNKEKVERLIKICRVNKFDHDESDGTDLDWLIRELFSALNRERTLGEALEWYAKWDWSDKYVQAIPKRAVKALEQVRLMREGSENGNKI